MALRAAMRLRPLLGSGSEPYRYEPDLEEFLRWSPSVRTARERAAEGDTAPKDGFDALSAGELIDLIGSLEIDALRALRRYEAEHQRRAEVLEALDASLVRHSG